MTRAPTDSTPQAHGSSLSLLLLLLAFMGGAASSALAGRVVASPAHARARYRLSLPGIAAPVLHSYVADGHHQRSRRGPHGSTDLTVLVSPAPLTGGTAWPVPPHLYPAGVRDFLLHDSESLPSGAITTLARELTRGLHDEAAVSERILVWVSVEVAQVQNASHDDSASSTLDHRRGSCVGRSRLAVSLLREAGLPARTVHGLVLPRQVTRGTALGSADFALHRFVKSYLLADGWVFSDPGESVHLVDTRHLILALDGQDYEPEGFRHLRLTPLEELGSLRTAGLDPGDRSLVVRAVHRPVNRSRSLPRLNSEVYR